MGMTTFVTMASLGLATLTTPATQTEGVQLAQADPYVSTQGVSVPRGDYMTNAKGCTYRKTQAPGYPPRWILVVNPQRIGLPMPPKGCTNMR